MSISLDLSLSGWHHAFGGQSPPIIILTSGSGYAGSVLQSSAAGQWTADGVAISGATGNTYKITVDTEGKDIRCGNSNVFAARWLPSQLSGLVAWFDANYGIGLNGSNVASWTSRVGSIVASQTTAANQPAYSATGLNSNPAIVSDGVNDNLKLSSIVGLPLGANDGFISATIAAVGSGAGGVFFGYGAADYTNGCRRCVITPTGLAYDHDGPYDPSITIAISSTAPCLYLARERIGVKPALRYNTTQYNATNTGIINTKSNGGYIFGRNQFGDLNANVKMAELILGGVATDEQFQKIEGYQAHKWGLTASLPSDHPYKNSPPMKV